MKKFAFLALIAFLALPIAASAQPSKMALSVGGDVLIPIGSFSDAFGIGFGGSARFQYNFHPMFSAGLAAGYFTWTGKDIAGFTGPSYSGIPIRVFGKYYFMPAGKGMRAYGIAELGLFIGSVGDQTIQTPLGNFTVEGGSETAFNLAPGLGLEVPIAAGGTNMDFSARYELIAKEGTASNFAFRVAVIFPLGN